MWASLRVFSSGLLAGAHIVFKVGNLLNFRTVIVFYRFKLKSESFIDSALLNRVLRICV